MSTKRTFSEAAEPADADADSKRRRKSRWQEAAPDGEEEAAPDAEPAGADKLAALQAQINAQMSNVKQLLAAKKTAPAAAPPPPTADSGFSSGFSTGGFMSQAPFQPAPLRLDRMGREVDAGGKLVMTNKLEDVATLKINTKIVAEKIFKEVLPLIETDPTKNKFFDPNIRAGGDRRAARKQAFKFTEEGSETHKKAAERMRSKLTKKAIADRYGKVQQAPAPIVSADGGDNPNLIEIGIRQNETILPFKQEGPIPEMEWWDAHLVPNYVNPEKVTFDDTKITFYIQHPIPIEPLCEARDQGAVALPLTQKERKKLRTRNRIEAEKEKQAQIRVGLLAPPPPKVKISNMMKALLNEAVQDPSKIEQQVRAAMAQRQRNHDLRNEERKLKPEERRQKKLKKIMDETAIEVVVAIYRVEDFSNPQHRYKVDINAAQLHLTGCVVMCDEAGCSVVVAEGGRKSVKKFSKLLTQRIKWREDDMDQGNNSKAPCKMVWEGIVKKASFKNFRLDEYRTGDLARKFLSDKGVGQYWDMCLKSDE